MKMKSKPALYQINVGTSNHGKPMVYEWGGNYGDGGNARVIASLWGRPMCPLNTTTHDLNRCSNHASFHAFSGQYIIDAHLRTDEYAMTVWVIRDVYHETSRMSMKGSYKPKEHARLFNVRVEHVCSIYAESDINTLPPWIRSAAKAADEKVRCYHCTHVHYAKKRWLHSLLHNFFWNCHKTHKGAEQIPHDQKLTLL